MRLSENIAHVKPSATLAVAALAREMKTAGRRVVDLSAGQPDFGTPSFIAEAGKHAIDQGRTRYAPAPGLPELRSVIATDLADRFGVETTPAGVVVTAGAKQAIFNALFTLFGPGDGVLVPTPYWTSYPVLVGLARARPVEVAGPEADGFKVRPEDLERARDGNVRGMLLNSPTNPSGAVYSLEELEALAGWAAEHDIWIVSDEIYGRIFFGAERAPGMLDLDPALRRRLVLVDGASKSFAMTGWRIGFSYCDPELAGRMAALQSHITTSAATPNQVAAATAYSRVEERDRAVSEMVAAFARRRDRVLELFAHHLPGVPFIRPEGAFYLFFRADDYYRDGSAGSVELCRRILEEAEVALVPGAAFGDDRFIRLSFAAAAEEIEEGIGRIGRLLGAL